MQRGGKRETDRSPPRPPPCEVNRRTVEECTLMLLFQLRGPRTTFSAFRHAGMEERERSESEASYCDDNCKDQTGGREEVGEGAGDGELGAEVRGSGRDCLPVPTP